MATFSRHSPKLLGVLALSSTAAFAADHPSARLVYSVSADAKDCPDESSFRTKVAGRLGYEPFTATDDARFISIRLLQESTQLRARMEVRTFDAGAPAVRELGGDTALGLLPGTALGGHGGAGVRYGALSIEGG